MSRVFVRFNDQQPTLSRINLNKRVVYLSHALMCIQAAEETRSNLELKARISDQLDVARVQQKVR